MITNPILTGFNPDPSICRVGDDFYIATSTFDWFPGVQIHHSRDLVHWHLLTRPLTRVSQLNMKGNPDSCGVWAPNLTYKVKRLGMFGIFHYIKLFICFAVRIIFHSHPKRYKFVIFSVDK